ncbi:MAG: oxidoreductase [Gammaproteobacteria bacterium]|nr:oxidoreductase [Gammaproteobacteria bacterium]
MEAFRAFRVHSVDKKVSGQVEEISLDDLSEGEVVIKTAYSDINYKDALAATGAGKIMRRFPMVGGVDLSGHVVSSSDARLKEGQRVVVIGGGLSEEFDGGFAEYARVPADTVVALPDGLSLRDAMGLGTAGFTAALAVQRMEQNGQTPALGPIAVNGATGGVGSFAIDMLAGRGYEVTALTGKRDEEPYLRSLGASAMLFRDELEMGERPLERTQWGGAVDNVGSSQLAWFTRTVVPDGNIAAIGLAGGIDLSTTVMPFILRGINLLGINSVLISLARRQEVWGRIGSDLKPKHLDKIVTREVTLDELNPVFEGYISGTVTGRTVVRIGGE